MQVSDLFAYLAAFVTILLALGLSDMVQSLHRLISARSQVRWRVLPLAAAMLIFLLVVSEFFSLSLTFGITEISYLGVLGLLSVPLFTAMAAFAALPDQVPEEGLDLGDFYLGNRRYLYTLLGIATLADYARLVLTYAARHGAMLDTGTLLTSGALSAGVLAVYGLMAWRRERWVHGAGLAVMFALCALNFGGWTVSTVAAKAPAAAGPHS